MDADQQAILNDLLHNNPYTLLPVRSKSSSRLHRSSSSSFNATNTRVLTAVNTSKSTNLGQSMATEHLAAGAHTKPSVLLARDLYAEKLRSLHLERQLSSSRVALRRSQQKQHDLQLSAVRKRTQHSKSVWSLLDKAARQTQRNPPLALTHAVPNLSSERDPVELLRQSIQHLEHSASYSSNTTNTTNTTNTSNTSTTTNTTNTSNNGTIKYRPNVRNRPRSRKRRKKKTVNMKELPLSANVILPSPSSLALRKKKMVGESRGPKRNKKVEWEHDMTIETPTVPLPLPVYEDIEEPLPSKKLIPRSREMSYNVGGDHIWHTHYPGTKTKETMTAAAVPKTTYAPIMQTNRDPFLSTVGAMQTMEERSTARDARHDTEDRGNEDYCDGDGDEYNSSNMLLPQNDTTPTPSVSSQRAPTTRVRNTPLLDDPYNQFALEIKHAARKRRRLLMEILGTMEYQFEDMEMKERKEHPTPPHPTAMAANGTDLILSEVPLTSITLTRFDLKKIMVKWRLGDSINIKNTLDRLCHRVCTTRRGQPIVDGRLLLSAMRKMVGSTYKQAKQIFVLKKSIAKKVPIMLQPQPLLPGSKLDQRREYQIPPRNYPVRNRNRTRWDYDEVDAVSMFIVPISERPEKVSSRRY